MLAVISQHWKGAEEHEGVFLRVFHIFWGFLCGAGKGSVKQEQQNLAVFSVLSLATVMVSFLILKTKE